MVSVDNGILKGFWRKIGISDISKNSESSWTSIDLNTQENRGKKNRSNPFVYFNYPSAKSFKFLVF